MAWMVVAAIANKLLTSIAQIVLGWKLDPEDFSVYAVATGVAAGAAWARTLR
jgi:O-antigen/teichoic acid export membrane protein